MNQDKLVVAQEPSTPGAEDEAFEQWYETKFKHGFERGPLDKYVARKAWFSALYDHAAPCARCAELDSTFGQVIADAAKELGCDPDNEAILESIFALSTKLKQQTERADFAWKNTQTIDKARAEEMLKRDELQAKITEQAARIKALEAEAADRESFIKTLADTCTEAERIAIERAGRIDALESECRKLRDALSETEAFCKRKDITIERQRKVIKSAKTALENGLEDVQQALTDFDNQYRHHPAVENERVLLVKDVEELTAALSAIAELEKGVG